MNHIKNFIWNHFVLKYFNDWIDDYVHEEVQNNTYDYEPLYYDLD